MQLLLLLQSDALYVHFHLEIFYSLSIQANLKVPMARFCVRFLLLSKVGVVKLIYVYNNDDDVMMTDGVKWICFSFKISKPCPFTLNQLLLDLETIPQFMDWEALSKQFGGVCHKIRESFRVPRLDII